MTGICAALGCLFAYLVLAPPPTYDWQPAPAAYAQPLTNPRTPQGARP